MQRSLRRRLELPTALEHRYRRRLVSGTPDVEAKQDFERVRVGTRISVRATLLEHSRHLRHEAFVTRRPGVAVRELDEGLRRPALKKGCDEQPQALHAPHRVRHREEHRVCFLESIEPHRVLEEVGPKSCALPFRNLSGNLRGATAAAAGSRPDSHIIVARRHEQVRLSQRSISEGSRAGWAVQALEPKHHRLEVNELCDCFALRDAHRDSKLSQWTQKQHVLRFDSVRGSQKEADGVLQFIAAQSAALQVCARAQSTQKE
mmetsp:Transcript_24844/g.81286  ORF Transcript_24844/g.81286 Transcript_24844/m.81286 type:complete len:261 (+) Transcript_24844:1693-2475(+)